MATTINWSTKIITVLRADMVLIQSTPTEIRQFDLDVFRLRLRELEAADEGLSNPKTHTHNTTVTVGGAILARVVSIINGYTVTFEDGQYAVNLVNANSNVGDVVNVNQVSVRSANSAGLQDLNSLQAASFGGGVTIDTASINTGVIFPVGTRAFPVNNTPDALTIATTRGIINFFVPTVLTLSSADFSKGFTFIGDNPVVSTLVINLGANVTDCTFRNLTISGTVDDNNQVVDCTTQGLTHVNGSLIRCCFTQTITLEGTIQATFFDCFSGVAGSGATDTPIIDMGGSLGPSLALRDYNGGIRITNCTNASADSTLDMNSGRVIIDSTVTNGKITIRGTADVVDNSTGSAIIVDATVNKTLKSAESAAKNAFAVSA